MRSVIMLLAALALSACATADTPQTTQLKADAPAILNEIATAAQPYCSNYRCRQASVSLTNQNIRGMLAATNSDSTIYLTQPIWRHLASADDLAFTLAHEYAHLIFRHHDTPAAQRVWLTQETQADCAAAYIMRLARRPLTGQTLLTRIKEEPSRIDELSRLASSSAPIPTSYDELAAACGVAPTTASR